MKKITGLKTNAKATVLVGLGRVDELFVDAIVAQDSILVR